jgi:1-acyl-sn-glycerol-3-phosphate acyltransferase
MILLCTIMMGTLSLIASFFDRTGNSQHRVARAWARMLLAVSFIAAVPLFRQEGTVPHPVSGYAPAARRASAGGPQ